MALDFSPLVNALAKSKQDKRDEERLQLEKKRMQDAKAPAQATLPNTPAAPKVEAPDAAADAQPVTPPMLYRPQLQGQLNTLGDQAGTRPPPMQPPARQALPPGTPTYGSPYAPQQETLSVEDKLRSLGYY